MYRYCILFFVAIFPMVFLCGCIKSTPTTTSNNPKKILPTINDVRVSLLTQYSNAVEQDYVRSTGLSFKFKVESPQKCTISMCLNSFKSGYWKITGKQCVVKKVDNPERIYYINLPEGGNIYLVQPIDHDITEDILVNVCYNFKQTYTITGCLKKNEMCKFDIDNSVKGYLKVYNIYSKYDITKHRYVLLFTISYHPFNWTYITDNSKVLNGACYLSNVVSPETGKVSVKADLIVCENSCEHSTKTIYLSSSGETKQVSIYLPTDIQDTDRNIITMILNFSYIVFKQLDYGSITILHSS